MYVWNLAWSSKVSSLWNHKAKALLAASDIDACWTKNQGKHTHIWGLLQLLRERPGLPIATCHIYIHMFVCVCVCVSMMTGGDGQRLSRTCYYCSLSEVTCEFMCPLSFCGYDYRHSAWALMIGDVQISYLRGAEVPRRARGSVQTWVFKYQCAPLRSLGVDLRCNHIYWPPL